MIYLGTHDLPIYHFTKCLVKSDLRYMVIGWNERDEIKIPKKAEEKWFEIFNEYCRKTSNNETDTFYALINEIDYLKKRHTILRLFIDELKDSNKHVFGEEIKKWGFNFDLKKTVESQKKSLEKQMRAAKQTIELKENENERINKDNKSGEPTSLYKKKIRLERIIGVTINLKETVLDEWFELIKEAESIVETTRKERNKNE